MYIIGMGSDESRTRGDCRAPLFTLLGIATGLSVALLAFGPGLFFLVREKDRGQEGQAARPPAR